MFRPESDSRPAVPPDLDASIARLTALAGTSPPPVPKQGTERERFFEVLPALREPLRPLLPKLGGSLLARLLGDTPFDGEPEARHLPKEAKKALKAGILLASSDATAWILVERPDGTAEVSRAHPEGYAVLGDTLGAWLAAEADTVESASRPARKKGTAAGKEAIDAVLVRLSELSNGPDLGPVLAAHAPNRNHTRWNYLNSAVVAAGAAWSPALLAALEGRLLGRLLAGKLHDTDDEACIVDEDDDELDGVNPIYVGRYPKAARKLLEAGHIVAASGPEVWFILREAKGSPMSWNISLHHAGYEGYERLADSVEAWLQAELARLEARL